MKSETDHDPEEVKILAAEVSRDLASGQGGKHFEREIDDLHSLHARHTQTEPDHEVLRRLHVFCRDFRDGLNDQLRGSGLRCIRVIPDGHGQGLAMAFVDRQGRPFDVTYTFDEGMAASDRDPENMGREMIAEVTKRLMNERARYFARMS